MMFNFLKNKAQRKAEFRAAMAQASLGFGKVEWLVSEYTHLGWSEKYKFMQEIVRYHEMSKTNIPLHNLKSKKEMT